MSIFQIEGEEVIEKVVGPGKFSGQIYVHKKYIGKLVKIVFPSNSGNGTGEDQGDQGVQGEQGEKEEELA